MHLSLSFLTDKTTTKKEILDQLIFVIVLKKKNFGYSREVLLFIRLSSSTNVSGKAPKKDIELCRKYIQILSPH